MDTHQKHAKGMKKNPRWTGKKLNGTIVPVLQVTTRYNNIKIIILLHQKNS